MAKVMHLKRKSKESRYEPTSKTRTVASREKATATRDFLRAVLPSEAGGERWEAALAVVSSSLLPAQSRHVAIYREVL